MATHYADASGQTVTMCGRKPGTLTISQTKEHITCGSCRSSMRWVIHFQDMTWEQANRHMKRRAELERQYR